MEQTFPSEGYRIFYNVKEIPPEADAKIRFRGSHKQFHTHSFIRFAIPLQHSKWGGTHKD